MSGVFPKGLVFGVFDGMHEGHKYFLNEAAKRCENLVVVVARPETVKILKNRSPKKSLEERMKEIRSFNSTYLILPGDMELGKWSVFKTEKIGMVFLGHDQHQIAKELDKMRISYTYLSSH